MPGRALAAAAVVAVALCASNARAADEASPDFTAFNAAQTQFSAGHYDAAHQLFSRLLDPNNAPCGVAPAGEPCRLQEDKLIQGARADDAASLWALGRGPEADPLVEQILLNDPLWIPAPSNFNPSAQARIKEIKTRLQPQLDKILDLRIENERRKVLGAQKARQEYDAWIDDLETRAGNERVVEHSSRLPALLPLGLGQFWNGDRGLGFVFLTAEVLAGGASIGSGIAANSYFDINQFHPQGTDARGQPVTCNTLCKQDLASDRSVSLTINRGTFIGWAGITVIDIAVAQFRYSDQREMKTRRVPLPPPPKLQPTFSFLPTGGVSVGVGGLF